MRDDLLKLWLQRTAESNLAGKFMVPMIFDRLPCGCGRHRMLDTIGRNPTTTVFCAVTSFRDSVENELFVVRTSLELKLKCGACDAEF